MPKKIHLAARRHKRASGNRESGNTDNLLSLTSAVERLQLTWEEQDHTGKERPGHHYFRVRPGGPYHSRPNRSSAKSSHAMSAQIAVTSPEVADVHSVSTLGLENVERRLCYYSSA
ncbi:hypothetical protein VTP01DRAFT_855 [Rhizomucor pusillus]|uniref:uncharacterized protein n=1 Tax=Rhizomucor pusillus TaxID=4840 RepID=UPI00374498CD